MTFSESGLQFKFGSNWVVKKYDEHAYFRGLSGKGLKGVDFIAIRKKSELVLIEVKNYRTRYNSDLDRSFEVAVKPVPALALELKKKVEDTLLAMDAVMQYYERSWWYRQMRKLWLRWPLLQQNRAFWTQADLLAKQHIHFVTWIALDQDDPQQYEADLLQQLKQLKIEAIDQLSIANGSHSPFPDVAVDLNDGNINQVV